MNRKETLVLCGLIAVLCLACGGGFSSVSQRPRIMKSVAHIDQVVKANKIYAMDFDGYYPIAMTDKTPPAAFANSTEAFNELIRETQLGTEVIFYVKGNPKKSVTPNQDGMLTKDENCLVYIQGQGDKTPARSPLIAEEMETPGIYGPDHPWIDQGKAVVGYCGGQVEIKRLRKTRAGAYVTETGISDIFQEVSAGGLLAVPRANILLP